jgi:hypothetical protein
MNVHTPLRAALATLAIAGALTTAACSSMDGGYANNQPISYASGAKAQPVRPPVNFASTRPATGNNVFIFDPKQLAWGAYNGQGDLVRTGIASGGADYCPDIGSRCHTPTGNYKVYLVKGAECKSSIFPLGKGGAPMPHCAFFNGGYAVHGSYDVPAYNASHGCIRVLPTDAAWLDDNIFAPGTTVIVKPYG